MNKELSSLNTYKQLCILLPSIGQDKSDLLKHMIYKERVRINLKIHALEKIKNKGLIIELSWSSVCINKHNLIRLPLQNISWDKYETGGFTWWATSWLWVRETSQIILLYLTWYDENFALDFRDDFKKAVVQNFEMIKDHTLDTEYICNWIIGKYQELLNMMD